MGLPFWWSGASNAKVGEPVRLHLAGWRPQVPVKVSLVYDGGAALDTATVIPGADGTFEWTRLPVRAAAIIEWRATFSVRQFNLAADLHLSL